MLEWLFARQRFGVKPGLGRVEALLSALGHPERAFKAVIVGGTNGKGSTASVLAETLHAAGKCGALFTSPHLSAFRERFVVDGEPLPDQAVEAALRHLKPEAEAVDATFFEIVTALACQLFADAEVDTAVLEVGMGGRYDATNALTPVLSMISNVSLDHTQVLGDTVEAIARDKAGIMRSGVTTLTTASGAGLRTLKEEAEAVGAKLTVLSPQRSSVTSDWTFAVKRADWEGVSLELHTPSHRLELHSSLLGPHQGANVALAAAAGLTLGVPPPALQRGVARARWPGRLERLSYRGRTVLLDGAHNPAAAAALRDTLQGLALQRCALVLGVNADKDAAGVAAPLLELARHIIFTRSTLAPKALEPAALAALVPSTLTVRAEVIADPLEALERALELAADPTPILIAGSLYLIGELRPHLTGTAGERLERWQ